MKEDFIYINSVYCSRYGDDQRTVFMLQNQLISGNSDFKFIIC